MASEVYTVLLRSADGTGTDLYQKSFSVNWEQLLPPDVKLFELRTALRSSALTNIDTVVLIHIDGVTPRVWSSKTQGLSTFVGTSRMMPFTADADGYGLEDPDGVLIDRPFSNNITVNLYDSGYDTAETGYWVLLLKLFPLA